MAHKKDIIEIDLNALDNALDAARGGQGFPSEAWMVDVVGSYQKDRAAGKSTSRMSAVESAPSAGPTSRTPVVDQKPWQPSASQSKALDSFLGQ